MTSNTSFHIQDKHAHPRSFFSFSVRRSSPLRCWTDFHCHCCNSWMWRIVVLSSDRTVYGCSSRQNLHLTTIGSWNPDGVDAVQSWMMCLSGRRLATPRPVGWDCKDLLRLLVFGVPFLLKERFSKNKEKNMRIIIESKTLSKQKEEPF